MVQVLKRPETFGQRIGKGISQAALTGAPLIERLYKQRQVSDLLSQMEGGNLPDIKALMGAGLGADEASSFSQALQQERQNQIALEQLQGEKERRSQFASQLFGGEQPEEVIGEEVIEEEVRKPVYQMKPTLDNWRKMDPLKKAQVAEMYPKLADSLDKQLMSEEKTESQVQGIQSAYDLIQEAKDLINQHKAAFGPTAKFWNQTPSARRDRARLVSIMTSLIPKAMKGVTIRNEREFNAAREALASPNKTVSASLGAIEGMENLLQSELEGLGIKEQLQPKGRRTQREPEMSREQKAQREMGLAEIFGVSSNGGNDVISSAIGEFTSE